MIDHDYDITMVSVKGGGVSWTVKNKLTGQLITGTEVDNPPNEQGKVLDAWEKAWRWVKFHIEYPN